MTTTSLLRIHGQLNPAQWRMLLDLHFRDVPVADVDDWLKRCQSDPTSLADLGNIGVVIRSYDEKSLVTLTEAGRRLVGHTLLPCRQALGSLSAGGRSIPSLLDHSRDDVSVFDALFSRAYNGPLVEMRDGRGEPVGHRPSWEEASRLGFGRNWPGITVHLTAKGRAYL